MYFLEGDLIRFTIPYPQVFCFPGNSHLQSPLMLSPRAMLSITHDSLWYFRQVIFIPNSLSCFLLVALVFLHSLLQGITCFTYQQNELVSFVVLNWAQRHQNQRFRTMELNRFRCPEPSVNNIEQAELCSFMSRLYDIYCLVKGKFLLSSCVDGFRTKIIFFQNLNFTECTVFSGFT